MTTPPDQVPAFELPRELSGGIPRAVRFTGGGIALAAAAVALAAGAVASAIVISVAFARAEDQRRLRDRDGVAGEAEVVQVTERRGDSRRRVAYRYSAGGRRHTGQARLQNSDRRSLREGTLISIQYLQSNPETSWMTGYEPDGVPLLVIPLVSISLLGGAGVMAGALRRQWSLLAEGRIAEARITGRKNVRKSGSRVSYEFRTLSGARFIGQVSVEKEPPPIGTLVPIVYHREDPRWSAIYPLPLVRSVRPPVRLSR